MNKNLINEISRIHQVMGVEVINEIAGRGLSNLLKTVIKSFTQNEKNLIKSFFEGTLSSVNKQELTKLINSAEGDTLITNLETLIKRTDDVLAKQTAEQELKLLKGLKSSKGKSAISDIPFVKAKQIDAVINAIKKDYPELFKKNIFGNYVNDGRIKLITSELKTKFEGKQVKDLVAHVEKQISDANTLLTKIKGNDKKKSYLKNLLSSYGKNLKENTKSTLIKTLVIPPSTAVVASLLYSFIKNWYETGDVIAGAMATGSDIWSSIKKGWDSTKSYENTRSGFINYLNEKYGVRNYKKGFKLTPPGSDGVIKMTDKNGVTKSFKHNGRTYIEL